MDMRNQQDPKQVFIQSYTDALGVLIRKTKSKNERLPVNEMINHAIKIAQYRTFKQTGVNIAKVNFGAQTERMHELAGASRVGKRFDKQIANIMKQTQFGYGSASGTMTLKTLGREVREYFMKAPEAKEELLKTLGLDKDGILTGASPLVQHNPLDMDKKVKAGSPEASPEAMAARQQARDAIESETRKLDAGLHIRNPENPYIENPRAIKQKDTLRVSESSLPGDQFHQRVDMTGVFNPQQEHSYLEDLLKRYTEDPYAAGADVKLMVPGTDTVVKDAFDNDVRRRMIPESEAKVLFPELMAHEFEENFVKKLVETKEYDHAFYGLFNYHGPAGVSPDQARADIQTAKDIASRYLTRVKQDSRDLRTINQVLQTSKKTKESIWTVLQKDAYKDTSIAKYIAGRTTDEVRANDKAVMLQLAQYMRRELFVRQSFLDADTLSHGRMIKAVSRKIRDIHNPEDRNLYGRANIYRQFMKDYREMIDDLQERKAVLSSEFQGYANFGITEEVRSGLLSKEEADALHKENTRFIKEMDFDDKVTARRDPDMLEDVGTSKRQQIRNLLLEQMEQTNSPAGNNLKHSLINTIENNIGALTTFAKSDSDADKKAADKLFAERLMTRLKMQTNSPWKNLTQEGAEAMIEGFNIDRTDLASTRARIEEVEARARKPLTTVLETKRQLERDRLAMWRDAAYQQEKASLSGNERFLRVPGRQGRFQIARDADGKLMIDGSNVTLRSEMILPTDIRVKIPVDHERLDSILEEMDTLKYNQELGRQYQYEKTKATIKESYVELRYQHQRVNEDLREEFEEFYNKLVRINENLHVGMSEDQIYRARSVVIPANNLLEPYHRFMSRADETSKARLPHFMRSMIDNQLSYMKRPDEQAKLASMAYMALADAITSLPEERTVDLSDRGLFRRFLLENPNATKEQKLKFIEDIKGKGLQTRLDEFLEDRVRNQMYKQFYNTFGESERRSAGASVVQDVVQHLKTEYGKTGRGEFQVTPSNVRSFVQKIGSDLRMMPFYEEALKFSEAEIGELIKEGELGNKYVSFEDFYHRLMEKADADTSGLDTVGLESVKEKHLADRGITESEWIDTMIKRDRDHMKSYVAEQAKGLADQLNEGVQIKTYNGLTHLYDLAKQNDPHMAHLDAVVNIAGKDYEARIRQASGGEMMAYVPALNRQIFIPRHESEALRTYGLHEFEPEMSFSGRTVDQLTASRGVRRTHVGDYSTIQRNVQADPSDTFDFIKQLTTGKKNGVYMDMETTGLAGSTLDPKLIQPLEIYMQEAQWNPKANDFYRVKGEVGVRQNGRTKKVAEHIFIQPSEDVVSYAHQLMNRFAMPEATGPASFYPLSFGVGENTINIMDVLAKKADSETWRKLEKQVMDQPGGVTMMHKINKAADDIWFLRNLAKYSGNQANFAEHIGSNDKNLKAEDMREFLDRLFTDTRQALTNFEINPKTGKLNLFTQMPEFRRAKVMTPEQAVQRYADFTRNRIVMGQNVAEADIQKIVGMADNFVEAAKANVMLQKEGIIDGLTRDFEAMRDPIHDSYATLVHPEDPTRRFSLIPGHEVDAILNAQSEFIEPHMLQSLGEALGDDSDLMAQAMQDVAQRHHGGDASALRQYMEDPADGLRSVFVVPQTAASPDRRIEHEKLIESFRNASTPDEMISLMEKHGVGDLTTYHTAKGLRAEVARPEVMEQMFAASYAIPGLRRRNAESVMEALGMQINKAQHTAAADVREGLQVFRDLIQRMLGTEEFQKYDGGLLQKGDFVHHHATTDSSVPLGTYQIDHVGTDHIQMTPVSFDANGNMNRGTSQTIYAENPMDLNRKYQLNFDFLGDASEVGAARTAYNEFAEDQARRQISRATQSLFNFDRYDIQSQSSAGPNALDRLARYRESMTGEAGSGFSGIMDESRNPLGHLIATPEQQADLEPLINRVALDSERVFNRADFKELANWDISFAKQAAFSVGADFYKSEEGLARRAFLAEVDAMQTFNVIDDKVGRDLIRSMNASIIEAGRAKGYTRVPTGMAHAGVMTDAFGSMAGEQMALNISSKRRLNQSLYSFAERIMKERDGGMVDGVFMSEMDRKSDALNKVLFPFLKEQGILQYEKDINMDDAINQIMARPVLAPGAQAQRGALQQFEEYDYLAFQKQSPEERAAFAETIRQKHEELLEPWRKLSSPVQQELIAQRNADIETLKEHGMYEPNMVMRPEIDLSKHDITTLSFNDLGGIKQVDTGLLEQRLNQVRGSGIVEDVELRRNIMNELFERATAGRPNSIEGLISENLHDPDRMEAARILGWVTGDRENGYKPATDIGEMYFGGQHFTGKNNPLERFADKKIKELPMPVIENILGQDYTENSGESFAKGLLYQYTHEPDPNNPKEWKLRDWKEDHQGPRNIPVERVKRSREVTADDLIAAGVPENEVPSHLREMTEARLEGGEAAAQKKGVFQETDMDMSKRVREPGAIGNWIKDTRRSISEFVGEGGAGHTMMKGAGWVAGIGIAAYALKQFATAGGPLKFEHRPQGHGVEGIGATGDNDDMNRNDLQPGNSPAAGGKAYVTPQGSNKGFHIKARARNNGNVDHRDITNDLQSDIGSFNINLRDDRQKMDRDWLQGQMDQYISRGHLG